MPTPIVVNRRKYLGRVAVHEEDQAFVATSTQLNAGSTSLLGPAAGEQSTESPDHDSPDQQVSESSSVQVMDGLGEVANSLRILQSAVERFHERSVAHEDLIQRMQRRIDDLQRDQVRVLLGPMYEELVSLQADLAEVAARDRTDVDPQRLGKELTFLVTRVDMALHMLGLESVNAAPGVKFDSRLHTATRRVLTGTASLDRTIERVYRQGFTFPGAKKVSMHARVTVYEFDPALGDDPGPDPEPPPPVEPPAGVAGGPEPGDPAKTPERVSDHLSPLSPTSSES